MAFDPIDRDESETRPSAPSDGGSNLRDDFNRHLLFGVFALQMDFISREQLIAATSKWLMDKSQPLEEILVHQGALADSDRALLLPLVSRHLDNHRGDVQKSLVAISSVKEVWQDLESFDTPDIYETVALIRSAANNRCDAGFWVSNESETAGESAVDSRQPASMRYRVLKPFAKGGLGEVSVAEDIELRRKVALKEIQSRYADDPECRTRFILEAEVTGGLEHPSIVPVYGFGLREDGRPYYAMRFIRGESLREAVDRFHQLTDVSGKPRSADFHGVSFRKLLAHFVDVCNAIEYAHSRGVLHRDIKPSNVMLGKYGETLVVDWGLAKLSDETATPRVGIETTVFNLSGSGSAKTQAGTMLGTPAFMSPEQAAGKIDELTSASDVYSLGATLYYLLTGKPPFDSENLAEMLPKVRAGDFARPRNVRESIPKPLEAICLRAMARECRDRYQSSQSLANDVECYLADEPTEAYREPLPVKSMRWIKRHRTIASSAAVALLCVAIASLVFLQQRRVQLTSLQESLHAVQVLRESAERDPVSTSGWKQALVAAERAIAAHALWIDCDPGRSLQVEHERILEASIRAERDQFLVSELDAIRSSELDDSTLSATESFMLVERDREASIDEQFSNAFHQAGFLVDIADPKSVSQKIKTCPEPIVHEIAVSLDYWALIRQQTLSNPLGAKQLRNIAQLVDNDPWRQDLRDVLNQPDRDARRNELKSIGERTPIESLSAKSIDTLAKAMSLHDDVDSAIALLNQGVMRHPEDPWLAFHLASLLEYRDKPEEALRYFTVARALKPDIGHQLAHLLDKLGRHEDAFIVFRSLVDASPSNQIHLACFSRMLMDHQEFDESKRVLVQKIDAKRAENGSSIGLASELATAIDTVLEMKDYSLAERLARECFEIRAKEIPDSWYTFNAKVMLGRSLTGRGMYQEAETLLLDGYNGLIDRIDLIPAQNINHNLPRALGGLAALYESWGKDDLASKWRSHFEQWESNRTLAEEYKSKIKQLISEASEKESYGKINQALTIYEQMWELPAQAIDSSLLRAMYCRSMQWAKASEEYVNQVGLKHYNTAIVLYAANRLDEYFEARRQLFDDPQSLARWGVAHYARMAMLMPVETEYHGIIRSLAEANGKEDAYEWQKYYVGPLMYRLDEFPTWYQQQNAETKSRAENQILAAICRFRETPTQEHRRELLNQVAKQLILRENEVHDDALGIYWHTHVEKTSLIEEAKRVYGDDAGFDREVSSLVEFLDQRDELYDRAIKLAVEGKLKQSSDIFARILDWQPDWHGAAANGLQLAAALGDEKNYQEIRKATLATFKLRSPHDHLIRQCLLRPLADDEDELVQNEAHTILETLSDADTHATLDGYLAWRTKGLSEWFSSDETKTIRNSGYWQLIGALELWQADPTEFNRINLTYCIELNQRAAFAWYLDDTKRDSWPHWFLVTMAGVQEARHSLSLPPLDLSFIPQMIQSATKIAETQGEVDQALKAGDFPKATASIEELRFLTSSAWIPLRLGDLYSRTLNWTDAVNALERTRGPTHYLTLLAIQATDDRDEWFERASQAFEEIDALDEGSLWALGRAIQDLCYEQQFAEQIRLLYRRLRKLDASDPNQKNLLAELAIQLGERDDADQQALGSSVRMGVVAAIDRYSADSSAENRLNLQHQSDSLQEALLQQIDDSKLIYFWWWEYVRDLTLYRRSLKLLGHESYRTAEEDLCAIAQQRKRATQVIIKGVGASDAEFQELLSRLPDDRWVAPELLKLAVQLAASGRLRKTYLLLQRAHQLQGENSDVMRKLLPLAAYLGELDTYRDARRQILAGENLNLLDDGLAQACLLYPLEVDLVGSTLESLARRQTPTGEDLLRPWIAYAAGEMQMWSETEEGQSLMSQYGHFRLLYNLSELRKNPGFIERSLVLRDATLYQRYLLNRMCDKGSFRESPWGFVFGLALVRQAYDAIDEQFEFGDIDIGQLQSELEHANQIVGEVKQAIEEKNYSMAAERLQQTSTITRTILDTAKIRDLDGQTMRWEYALADYLQSADPTHHFTLHLLFQCGRQAEYNEARAAALRDLANTDGDKDFADYLVVLGRAVTLTPIGDEDQGPARALAERLQSTNPTETWKRAVLGRLKLRLGEFPEWFAAEQQQHRSSTEYRLLNAIDLHQSAPTDATADELERFLDQYQTMAANLTTDGILTQPWWWNYVHTNSFVKELQQLLE